MKTRDSLRSHVDEQPGEYAHQIIGKFSGISLEQMQRSASLLQRRDRKYVCDSVQSEHLFRSLESVDIKVLDINGRREFTYYSTYFDTPNFLSYHDAATNRRRRFKVRHRHYVNSGEHFLELKTKGGRSQGIKDRYLLSEDDVEAMKRFASEGFLDLPHVLMWLVSELCERHIYSSVDQAREVVRALHPVSRTEYVRSTFVTSENERVTFDRSLQLVRLQGEREECIRGSCLVPLTIVETKTLGKLSEVDRILWRQGIRPISISKYALSIAYGYGLPANKWTRALKTVTSVAR
ncbi:MAG: VTC domain-containing protein [Actinomycetaceae bacterium]|nr:VTC domain-containing protein [Actinomycetaceae bacterium]